MQVPVVGVAGKLNGNGVVDRDGDLAVAADDGDVVWSDREVVLPRLRQDRSPNPIVIVRAGRMRLVDDGLPQLGGLHLHGDHLPCHEDGQTKKDETDQTPELTLTPLATTLAHNDLRRG